MVSLYYLLMRDALSHELWHTSYGSYGLHMDTGSLGQIQSFVDPAHIPFQHVSSPPTKDFPCANMDVPITECFQLVFSLTDQSSDRHWWWSVCENRLFISRCLFLSFSVRIIMEEEALLRERLQAITVSIRLDLSCYLVYVTENWGFEMAGVILAFLV